MGNFEVGLSGDGPQAGPELVFCLSRPVEPGKIVRSRTDPTLTTGHLTSTETSTQIEMKRERELRYDRVIVYCIVVQWYEHFGLSETQYPGPPASY